MAKPKNPYRLASEVGQTVMGPCLLLLAGANALQRLKHGESATMFGASTVLGVSAPDIEEGDVHPAVSLIADPVLIDTGHRRAVVRPDPPHSTLRSESFPVGDSVWIAQGALVRTEP